MNRSRTKTKAKNVLKKNYFKCVGVCLLVALLINTSSIIGVKDIVNTNKANISQIEGKTNTEIVNEFINGITKETIPQKEPKYTQGVLATLFNNITASNSFVFGILNALNQFLFEEKVFAGTIIAIGGIIAFIYWVFISNVLKVGQKRFFLENKNYKKTEINRILLPYRVKRINKVSRAMLVKNIDQFLWSLTIIGGPIKYYSYFLVPYILAENPNIKAKEAIELSKNMMYGYKWEMFKIDLSLIFWRILGLCTYNITNILFLNPYKETVFAEKYFELRSLAKKKKIKNSEYLCDTYLEKEGTEYPEEKYIISERERRAWLKVDSKRDYSITSYILLFMIFSMIGWIWEVCLHLFSSGTFVNRGTLYGPWLPIYGTGGVLILLLLKKVREKPIVTFALCILICGIVEYSTAWYLETVKYLRWWDYTGYFLNIQGRICLEGLIVFGIGGCVFIYFLAPLLDEFIKKIPVKVRSIICVIFLILIAFDFAYSSKHPNTGEGITNEIMQESRIGFEIKT